MIPTGTEHPTLTVASLYQSALVEVFTQVYGQTALPGQYIRVTRIEEMDSRTWRVWGYSSQQNVGTLSIFLMRTACPKAPFTPSQVAITHLFDVFPLCRLPDFGAAMYEVTRLARATIQREAQHFAHFDQVYLDEIEEGKLITLPGHGSNERLWLLREAVTWNQGTYPRFPRGRVACLLWQDEEMLYHASHWEMAQLPRYLSAVQEQAGIPQLPEMALAETILQARALGPTWMGEREMHAYGRE